MTPYEAFEKDAPIFSSYLNLTINPTAELPFLLREWNRAKAPLFSLFGEKLKVSRQIEVLKDSTVLSNELNALFDNSRFYSQLFSTAYSEKLNFLYDITIENYINNKITLSSPFLLPNGKKIQDGEKLMKVFSKIVEAYPNYFSGNNTFEEFRLAHSRILNEKVIRGELTLSIHPLDYITASDNDNGWSSCMSWLEGGCYRRGTVEMMNSPMVVCAYISSGDTFTFNNYSWNNKKWREFLICDFSEKTGNPMLISGIKGYPYWNKTIEKEALSFLLSFIPNASSFGEFFDFGPESSNLRFRTDAMYNDFYGSNPNYTAAYTPDFNFETIFYSGASECMVCGDLNASFNSEESLECDDCSPMRYCDFCGEYYPRDEFYEVDDEVICGYCFDNLERDFLTGEPHLNRNLTPVYLASKEKKEVYKSCHYFYDLPAEAVKTTIDTFYYWYDGTTEKVEGYVIYIEDLSFDWDCNYEFLEVKYSEAV